MGVLSECLLLLLLVQALSIFTVQGEEAVDQPKGPIDDDLDLFEDEGAQVEIAPEEDTFLNFLEKRGKGKGGKGAKKPKGGKCNQPKKKRGRSVRQLNDDYVDWHNYYRCLHGVGKVGYSKALETVAKANVQMNVRQGGMSHTSNSQYGENLWAMWGTGFGLGAITGQDPVKAWYDEMKDPGYDFRAPTMFSYGTGHFTQVVWAATKKIGCFTAEHPYQGMTRVFTACEYDPPGNMNMRPRAKNVENWKKNVPKPK